MNKAIPRDYIPIGKIYTNGAKELHINAEELTCEHLNHIIVRCTDILRTRAKIKERNEGEQQAEPTCYNYIDLGLPSGTKWADMNIGAGRDTNCGDYFTFEEAQKYKCPSEEQIKELIAECQWNWVNKNGSNGYLIIGKNGNSIFLPAAGYRSDASIFFSGAYSSYCSSSLYTGNPYYACNLNFDSGTICYGHGSRFVGRSVRTVLNKS